MERDGMEEDIMKKVKLILRLKKEKEKEKYIIMMLN